MGGEQTPAIDILLLHCRCLYLDGLPFNLHRLLPEIHPDGGLGLLREAPPGEAEGEARLADVGVPDDDDLKDPSLNAQLQGGGEARGGIVAAAGSAPADSVEIHGGRQDGDIVVCSVPLCDASSSS